MKILMVTDGLGKGGRERRMLQLIKCLLNDYGYQVKLISLTNIVEYEEVYNMPVEFAVVKRRFKIDPLVSARLYSVIKKYNPDIVHSWGSMASLYLLPAMWLTGKKLLNGIIADAPLNPGWRNSYYWRIRFSSFFASRIISNSEAGIRSYKTARSKTVCIYNGIDMDRFKNLPAPGAVRRQLFGKNADSFFVAGMVAAFEDRKDYDSLLHAALEGLQQYPDWRFVLVGDGKHFERIRQMIPEIYQDKIIMTGKRSDIEALVNCFDVGILLTNSDVHGEGISNSIIEYMACAKPVIASRGGGTDELVLDGLNGFKIDSKNSSQLLERLKYCYHHANERAQMGVQAKTWCIEKFDLHRKTAEYDAIYHELLQEKNHRKNKSGLGEYAH
jgi:glycosyltransferase involved in cell wall biosynthesis